MSAPDEVYGEMGQEIMVEGYLACAIWTSTFDRDDRTDVPIDKEYDPSDVSDESREKATQDCLGFLASLPDDLALVLSQLWEPGQAGHDLWLTRNGHGVGFEDRAYDRALAGMVGKAIADHARKIGETYCYLGDDGKVHLG